MERTKAPFGLFLSLVEPKETMRREAADADYAEGYDGEMYPRIQMLTIKELLAGQRPRLPWTRRRRSDAVAEQTKRPAVRAKRASAAS